MSNKFEDYSSFNNVSIEDFGIEKINRNFELYDIFNDTTWPLPECMREYEFFNNLKMKLVIPEDKYGLLLTWSSEANGLLYGNSIFIMKEDGLHSMMKYKAMLMLNIVHQFKELTGIVLVASVLRKMRLIENINKEKEILNQTIGDVTCLTSNKSVARL